MTSTVYLEDIETARASRLAATKDSDEPPSSPGPSPPTLPKFSTQSNGSVKRQRTLMDMLSGSQAKTVSTEPSAKKVKLTASSSSSSMKPNGSTVFGVQKLNSIPFSLSLYQETLTEDQKGLLRLECEMMGKSW
ncbi:hypothetical protein C0991_007389 [Blastosporella zonata]|nr:hypothetical protein C0991_007389 [Blastosporella zonata]